MGTREALFAIRTLLQRCHDMIIDVYAAVDYQKALNRVKHEKSIGMLISLGIYKRNVGSISQLYWNQIAAVRVFR